jgi:hypothetical protein
MKVVCTGNPYRVAGFTFNSAVASVKPRCSDIRLNFDWLAHHIWLFLQVFVRKDTLKAFTQLYKAHANLVLQGQGGEESKFVWIPARIVRLVYDKDIK